jgi:hypothetical protein
MAASSEYKNACAMLLNFRLPPNQRTLEFVVVIADEGKVRTVAQIPREIIEDTFPREDYHRDRLNLIARNLDVLRAIIQAKFNVQDYTDYTDSLGITSGNDKLIIIGREDLAGHKLR